MPTFSPIISPPFEPRYPPTAAPKIPPIKVPTTGTTDPRAAPAAAPAQAPPAPPAAWPVPLPTASAFCTVASSFVIFPDATSSSDFFTPSYAVNPPVTAPASAPTPGIAFANLLNGPANLPKEDAAFANLDSPAAAPAAGVGTVGVATGIAFSAAVAASFANFASLAVFAAPVNGLPFLSSKSAAAGVATVGPAGALPIPAKPPSFPNNPPLSFDSASVAANAAAPKPAIVNIAAPVVLVKGFINPTNSSAYFRYVLSIDSFVAVLSIVGSLLPFFLASSSSLVKSKSASKFFLSCSVSSLL